LHAANSTQHKHKNAHRNTASQANQKEKGRGKAQRGRRDCRHTPHNPASKDDKEEKQAANTTHPKSKTPYLPNLTRAAEALTISFLVGVSRHLFIDGLPSPPTPHQVPGESSPRDGSSAGVAQPPQRGTLAKPSPPGPSRLQWLSGSKTVFSNHVTTIVMVVSACLPNLSGLRRTAQSLNKAHHGTMAPIIDFDTNYELGVRGAPCTPHWAPHSFL
jgi:hypothetical protein